MSRGYLSRRIASALQAPLPVQTPDTDAATIYRQTWKRDDGTIRNFDVLALDAEMAEEMGGLRLVGKYRQSIMTWHLEASRPVERVTSKVVAILMGEEPDETQLREETFFSRQAGASV